MSRGKFLRFSIVVQVEDKIVDDNELDEMAGKIGIAIANECQSGNGIIPDASETFTKRVYVSAQPSGKEQIIEVI